MPTSMFSPDSEFWSSDPVIQQTSPIEKAIGLGINLSVVGGGLYGASQTYIGNLSLLDHIQNQVRRYGYASPFSLLNTFRTAEFLSPFVTTGSLQLGEKPSLVNPNKNVVQYVVTSDILKGSTTKNIYQELFPELKSIENQLILGSGQGELIFEADSKSNTGSLYLRNTDSSEAPKLIKQGVSLQEIRSTEISPKGRLQSNTKINPAAKSILQGKGIMDMLEIQAAGKEIKGDTLLEEFGSYYDEAGDKRFKQRFMIIETPGLNKAGVDYARAFPAYGMERIKRLLGGVFDQVPILGKVAESVDNVYGFGEIKSGTASKMFARYGIRAAAISATYLGIEQLDYYRRNTGIFGDIGVSGLFSLAIAGATKKAFPSFTAPKAAAVGVAAFAAQMIMPGFEKGVFPGIANTAVNLDVASTAIGELTFMNAYRRTVEGIAPGFSSFEMSIASGILATGLSALGSDPVSAKIFRRLNKDQKEKLFGVGSELINEKELAFSRKRFEAIGIHEMTTGKFYTEEADSLLKNAFSGMGYKVDPNVEMPGFFERKKVMDSLFEEAQKVAGADGRNVLEKELFQQYNASLEKRKEVYTGGSSLANKSYYRQLEDIERRIDIKEIGRFQGFLEGIKAKVIHGFFGASFQGDEVIDNAQTLLRKNYLTRLPALFAVGFLAHSLVSGSLLGSMETADEKSAMYSGQKLVDVRRGRWWEGGGTPFGGRDIMYQRPHAYHQYMNRISEVATWGPDEDSISPLGKFFLKNFTYEMEKRNYYNRPFPITAGAFEDVPVIGNILAATVGQLIKPTRLMHVNDFMRIGPDGEVEYKTQNEVDRPAYSLGGTSHGRPVSPFETARVLSNTQYQFRELEGLTGWAKNMFQKASTGAETFGLDAPVMQSANAMDSINKKFWDMELGGGLLLSEPIRRFLPNKKSEIMEYNPIQNQMPTWLPERFHYGDPYSKVKSGTSRMPGDSYAALHPELKGVDPENYPDIYKYKILSDVAPTSQEFREMRERLYKRRASGNLSEKEVSMMDASDELLNKKISGLNYDIDPNAYNIPVVSPVARSIYGTGIDIIKDVAAPAEYIIPMGFRPTQKLLQYSNPIDTYEHQRLYGTMFSFWDKPLRDWFRPAFYSAAHMMGFDGTPSHVQRAREVNEHFDKLEFFKQMQLAQNSESEYQKKLHLRNAARTRYGINPQSSAMGMYQSLPDGEKEFFDAFSMATGDSREKILSMVPEDQANLYRNIYQRIDRGDTSLYPGGSQQVDEKYLSQKFYELDEYFQGKALPDQDWIGWHEQVDLDDVKVRYVENLGMDLYDVDMYNSKLMAQKRRAYLNGSEQALMGGWNLPGESTMSSLIRNTVSMENQNYPQATNINVRKFGSENRGYFEVNDDRRYEMIRMMQNANE